MSAFALLDCTAWIGGHDFSGESNKLTLETMAEELDATTFRSGGVKEVKGGLKSVDANLDGLWDVSPDAEGFDSLGTSGRVVTISPSSDEGDVAYMFQATQLKYSAFGNIGDLIPFSLEMQGSSTAGVVRGQIAKKSGSVTTPGAIGSAVELGAVSSTQFVYATLHVFGTPGSTITVKVESSDTEAFSGTPSLVQSFSAVTTSTGAWLTRKAGAITDTFYRFNVTAITGTFTVAGAIAVQ